MAIQYPILVCKFQRISLNACDTARAVGASTVTPFCCSCCCTTGIFLPVLRTKVASATVAKAPKIKATTVQCQMRIASPRGSKNLGGGEGFDVYVSMLIVYLDDILWVPAKRRVCSFLCATASAAAEPPANN